MGFFIHGKAAGQLSGMAVFVGILLFCLCFMSSDAFDPLDPYGNITMKWDIMTWTPDGYVAVVTLVNYQKYRHIDQPGWRFSWTWAQKEIIWSMNGGQATEQGDCSQFKGNIPHCCKRSPTIVDLMPGTPYNQQIQNCCKGGVLTSPVQDYPNSVGAFQVSVGQAGTTNKTVKLPQNFTLLTPGPGYTCGPAKLVEPSKFPTFDKRRFTQALMTWNVTCTYSQFLARRTPTCCVSLSAFYNETIVKCPSCTCGCENRTQPGGCMDPDTPQIASVVSSSSNNGLTPVLRCTLHMCPIRVHWHIKLNYRDYWRSKITITNFNYAKNYSNWNLVVQHPNFKKITQIFSFNYSPISSYGPINDTGMFWGLKYYNDMLMQSGGSGNVQSEMLFQKGRDFTFDKGWAFPRRIYFNGDNCVMPPPDAYPFLPNGSTHAISSLVMSALISLVAFVVNPW